MQAIKYLLEGISRQSDLFEATSSSDDRKTLIRSVHKLMLALETPMETTIRMTWANRATDACIQTGIKMNLFEKLSSKTPKSCNQLALEVDADPILLKRILNHLAAVDCLEETAVDTYAHTTFSQSLTDPTVRDAFPVFLNTVDTSITHLPGFLQNSRFENPSDPTSTCFHDVRQSQENWFDVVMKDPQNCQQFNNHMQGYVKGRKSWQDDDCYPVVENLVKGSDPEGVLFVDIGGGVARDVNAFRTKFGGKCILQELPEVVKTAKPVEGVQVQVHDMFTPQTITGARAYYFHSVFHDWTDKECTSILQNIAPVMKRGYSKVLINEYVIPQRDAYWMSTGLDIILMSILSGAERSEEVWHTIVEAAGLKISNIYNYEAGIQSLIEVELAETSVPGGVYN